MITYSVVYGFAEGPDHGRYFDAAMRAAGFQLSETAAAADIIIAHSGGCYTLAGIPANKTVVMCQPASAWLGPGWYAMFGKIYWDVRLHYQRRQLKRWLWKSRLNVRYLAAQPGRNLTIVRQSRHYRTVLPSTPSGRQLVIVNRDDPWSNRITAHDAQRGPVGALVGFSGAHDDLWTDPQPTIECIKAFYGA